ncbi:hypothetical protein PoB_005104500 [Plakobranchus ocellatus]|uniref:Uncharacterized protein n=1 Tax=Plakobranchus ocellatus TaxID=259542 RepID=A0AAV4BZH0_9GAST|nr:hypothetical protein PoB_005104500 [Plakobranchus ocellatus]
MSCNRTKGTYPLTECLSAKAHEDLVNDLKSSHGFLLLCDKATDITMEKIFCVNVRFVDSTSSTVRSELYILIPVEEGNADGLFDALAKSHGERLLDMPQTVRT